MNAITDYLFERLPTLACYLTDESWRDIADPLEHEPEWHQWGVLEHTGRVCEAMTAEVPDFCIAWGVPFIQELKAERIQNKSKWDLLLVTCVVHDLGKWAGRTMNSTGSYSFKGHEIVSEHLIRHNPLVNQSLREAGLSPEHIDYVARTSGLHYELGTLRQLGYRQGGFDPAFLTSDIFHAESETIAHRYTDYAREIGLIFLADSLAKVEFRVDIESLAEVEVKILTKGLSQRLIKAACQVPINIALCREYLISLKEQIITNSS